MQGAKDIDITVVILLFFSVALIGDLIQSGIVTLIFFEHKNKGKIVFVDQDNTVDPKKTSSFRTNSYDKEKRVL